MNNIPIVTDPSKRFYSGMTLNEAKNKGYDKSIFKRDFRDIDKNNDGTLSIKEIMNERETILKRRKRGLCGWGLLGAIDCFANASRIGKFIDIGLDILFAAYDIYQINKISKETKEFKRVLATNNINIYI